MEFTENAKPIYLQIADRICDEILGGVYAPDSRIPSVREYAISVQVNANTVMRSYLHLAAKDIIANKRGVGFFTTADAAEKIHQWRKAEFFDHEANYFFSRLRTMGVTPEALLDLYANYLKSKDSENAMS
ncbi:MAG: GntR family transcriptional regulator [Clostridium sp.]|nr:GntR family transcriptional regulator [Clostridium sp.]